MMPIWVSRVPAACKGSRLPQALVSSGSRAASQKGLLLSMWYTPVDTLAITVFSWAVRCGCLCGDDKSITSEAGEQKSDCVGVGEHPCGDGPVAEVPLAGRLNPTSGDRSPTHNRLPRPDRLGRAECHPSAASHPCGS